MTQFTRLLKFHDCTEQEQKNKQSSNIHITLTPTITVEFSCAIFCYSFVGISFYHYLLSDTHFIQMTWFTSDFTWIHFNIAVVESETLPLGNRLLAARLCQMSHNVFGRNSRAYAHTLNIINFSFLSYQWKCSAWKKRRETCMHHDKSFLLQSNANDLIDVSPSSSVCKLVRKSNK